MDVGAETTKYIEKGLEDCLGCMYAGILLKMHRRTR